MSTNLPEDKLTGIKDALFRGQKIEAIKLYRECTDSGLAEAKDVVEKLEAELRKASPEKFPASPPPKGCFGLVIFLTAILLILLWLVMR